MIHPHLWRGESPDSRRPPDRRLACGVAALQSDFYTVYRDMRRYETGDRTHDVREGKPLITKLS